MIKKEIPITVSVKLTQEEIDWVITVCEDWDKGSEEDDKTFIHLAKKLQSRLNKRNLKQPNHFGRGDKPMPTIKDMIKALKKGRVRFNF
ncbi:MAG: hypothetical protein Unbinned97contig1000_44 [Prokaryotic dsDNA virus sp.]|nr:MAG: hypothetical protein Unbinned97contig1000_44 [Prokaryotic dsDNA virus sp.]|tara:strand:+ start:3045 stop:3311 length:267 start_codon:yes stop_codon:yes gene_type:complete